MYVAVAWMVSTFHASGMGTKQIQPPGLSLKRLFELLKWSFLSAAVAAELILKG